MLEILQIAVIAYVFLLLTEDKMIFGWYGRLIERIKYDWLYYPMGGCEKCFAGQLALWYYLIKHFASYNLFNHVWFISAVILTVLIIDKIMTYESN